MSRLQLKEKPNRFGRSKLSEVLPLQVPFCINIFPINACNFKCKYCYYAEESYSKQKYYDKNVMSLKEFKKYADDISGFGTPIKTLRFVGQGEPLLHKDIDLMVKYAKEINIAEKVEIITNGSLLTNQMADKLIMAGLSSLLISIQGINSSQYEEFCGVDIDYNKLIENIKYFYENKKETVLHVKIIDFVLNSASDKTKYYDIFSNIADKCIIEPLCTNDLLDFSWLNTSKYRIDENKKEDICPYPFYQMQITPDGYVKPCCAASHLAPTIGNAQEKTIAEIWNSREFNEFRINMLNGIVPKHCENCSALQEKRVPKEDVISQICAMKLVDKYMKRINDEIWNY